VRSDDSTKRCKLGAATPSFEQHPAKSRFQLLNRRAERRLFDTTALSCARKLLFTRHGKEILDLRNRAEHAGTSPQISEVVCSAHLITLTDQIMAPH
jgi:hypothetical protein